MSNEDVLDTAQLENLRQLFGDGFKGLVETFLTDFEEKEKILADAIKDKKIDVVVKSAHFLKGSSANMGAGKLSNICLKVEMAGKQSNLEEINTHYNALQTIYTETKTALLKLI